MSPNVENIVTNLNQITVESLGNDEDAQFQILEAARSLVSRLQSPFERAWQLSWIGPNIHAMCQILLDIGLWEAWLEEGGKEASLEELLAMCKKPCDLALLRRIIRLLVCDNMVEETGEDRYRATPFSLAMGDTTGAVAQTILSGTHHGIDSARNLPQFLARTNYEEPSVTTNTNYMDLTPERLGMFARCGANPEYQASFILGLMAGLTTYKVDWTDVYDVVELLNDFDMSGNVPLLVDVGGAHGVDLMRFLAKCPDDMPGGKLVLQDLPDVVALARVSDKITTMGYDFFTEQPIKGSRAYFMHAILHDWDGIDARRILKRVGAAMEKGYSKLLIYETTLPPTGAKLYQSMADTSLMHLLSAGERTETRWAMLLASANLKVVKIWKYARAMESVIEAELA